MNKRHVSIECRSYGRLEIGDNFIGQFSTLDLLFQLVARDNHRSTGAQRLPDGLDGLLCFVFQLVEQLKRLVILHVQLIVIVAFGRQAGKRVQLPAELVEHIDDVRLAKQREGRHGCEWRERDRRTMLVAKMVCYQLWRDSDNSNNNE